MLPGHRNRNCSYLVHGFIRFNLLLLLGCLAGGACLGYRGFAEFGKSRTQRTQAAIPVGLAPSASPPRSVSGRFARIEHVRVGDRVVTPGTVANVTQPTAVDPSTWKQVSLRLEQTWKDGTFDPVDIEILVSPEWIRAHQSVPGATVPVPADLEELGLVGDPARASFRIRAIAPCPDLASGSGRVVLATLTHLNPSIFELTVVDASGRSETLNPTAIHRFWSEDRGGWVRTERLRTGERLQSRLGPVVVTSARQIPGVQRVYNLTVEGEHLYYVSGAALLTHNAGSAAESAPLAKVLEGHGAGQGFTGVYDASTGKVSIQPSTADPVIPDGWVAQAGGHADVSTALGGDAAITIRGSQSFFKTMAV